MQLNITKNTDEAILIEVVFEDMVDKMSNKGFSGKESFIKFTKGNNHTITLYDAEGNGYCQFSFGKDGNTLISDELSALRQKVYHFLLSQHIQPKKRNSNVETELKIISPKKGLSMKKHFCVHLGGKFAAFFKTEEAIKETFGEYNIYDTSIAVTGVTVHKAHFVKNEEFSTL